MAKKDGVIEIEGSVVEALPNAMFRVELANGQHAVAVGELHAEHRVRQGLHHAALDLDDAVLLGHVLRSLLAVNPRRRSATAVDDGSDPPGTGPGGGTSPTVRRHELSQAATNHGARTRQTIVRHAAPYHETGACARNPRRRAAGRAVGRRARSVLPLSPPTARR